MSECLGISEILQPSRRTLVDHQAGHVDEGHGHPVDVDLYARRPASGELHAVNAGQEADPLRPCAATAYPPTMRNRTSRATQHSMNSLKSRSIFIGPPVVLGSQQLDVFEPFGRGSRAPVVDVDFGQTAPGHDPADHTFILLVASPGKSPPRGPSPPTSVSLAHIGWAADSPRASTRSTKAVAAPSARAGSSASATSCSDSSPGRTSPASRSAVARSTPASSPAMVAR